MSPLPDFDTGAAAILARAARADAAASQRLRTATDDLLLPTKGRLDDETRTAVAARLAAAVEAIEDELACFAERTGAAPAVRGVLPPLLASGLLRDEPFMAELIATARLYLLPHTLGTNAQRSSDRSNLLARLCECSDGVVAAAAKALVSAENRRSTTLTAPVHRRLVWWVAAALVDARSDERTLADAAAQSIAAADSAELTDAAAMRLTAAIEPRPGELAGLLADALADARPALFIAVLAHVTAIDWKVARAITLFRGRSAVAVVACAGARAGGDRAYRSAAVGSGPASRRGDLRRPARRSGRGRARRRPRGPRAAQT